MKRSTTDHTRGHNQVGATLVEAIVGILVLTIVLLAAAQLFRVHVEHLALTERARQADLQANAIMNRLAAYNLSALPDGNPFSGKGATAPIADGEQIALDNNACLAQANCEQIAKSPQPSGTASDYLTLGWNQPTPTGSSIAYYTAWRVTTLDAPKGLRRITLALIPVEPGKNPTDPIEPLILRETDVVQRQ